MNMHNRMAPSAEMLKRAFSLLPSAVAIVTALDEEGAPHGFTASAFTPLSIDPPMILVCLNRSAQCYPAFLAADRFAVNVLRPEHQELALRFATRGADKFADAPFVQKAMRPPLLDSALASLECVAADRLPGGDHVILIGLVEQIRFEDRGAAMVHFARSFRALELSTA